MEIPRPAAPLPPRRIGVYGWGVVAPGARDVAALEALLGTGRSALSLGGRPELGGSRVRHRGARLLPRGLRRVDRRASRRRVPRADAQQDGRKRAVRGRRDHPGPPVRCAPRAAPARARRRVPRLHRLGRERSAGELPRGGLPRAGDPRLESLLGPACALRRCAGGSRANGPLPPGPPPPADPASLPVDTEERSDALRVWDAYWAERSDELREFLERFAAIERMDADDEDHDRAHLNAIRKRVRAHRALIDEVGCPPPPWTAVSPNLIWNIQNSPAAQVTMLLNLHGAAWAPVGACSTFGVALKCGRDAIQRGEAKMAIVGTTDPRPDAALVGRVSRGARHAGDRRGQHAVHVASRHARLGRSLHLDRRRRRVVRGARAAADRRIRRGRRAVVGRRAHHHAVKDGPEARHRSRVRGGGDHGGRRGRHRPARHRHAGGSQRARARRRLRHGSHADHRAKRASSVTAWPTPAAGS